VLLHSKNQLFTHEKTELGFPQQGPLFKAQLIWGHNCHLLLLQQEVERCSHFLHWKCLFSFHYSQRWW